MVVYKLIYLLVAFFLVGISIGIKLFPLNKETKISLGYPKKVFLNFTEATAEDQYASEEHIIFTEDGYILKCFRIVKGRNCQEKKRRRPILLMHGFLQNSDVFLDAGPSAGLAYLLSDACLDVWVGNQRGNNYGRDHLKLNPDKDYEFWNFSIDEMGLYDVPASIHYILNRTGADKVNYVGFSQGSSIFFAMCSERPDYCEKIGVMIALAPAVLLTDKESFFIRSTVKLFPLFKNVLNLLGIQEVFRKGEFFQELLEYLCQINGSSWIDKLCDSCAFMDNYHSGSVASDTRRLIFSHLVVGTSLNIITKYQQAYNSEKFQKFDYGEKINLEKYNSTLPPEYNLTSVTAPVLIIQGRNDKLVNIQKTTVLSTKLPNVLEMFVVPDPNWTHADMIYSQNINTITYPKIYEYLVKYSVSGEYP